MTRLSRAKADSPAGVLRTLHANRRLIGLSYRKLAVVGFFGTIAGFTQAALLLVVVRAAAALTTDTTSFAGAVGPFEVADLGTSQLIVIGFALLGIFVAAEVASTFYSSALVANAVRHSQKQMLQLYSSSSFTTQNVLSRGEASTVLMGHSAQSARLVGVVAGSLTALVNFVALVGSAIVISPVASIVVMTGLAFVVLLVRPLMKATRSLGGRFATAQRRQSQALLERLELNREYRAFGVERAADGVIGKRIDDKTRLSRQLGIFTRLGTVAYRAGGLALVLGMVALIDVSNTTNLAALTGSLLMLMRSLSYAQALQSQYQTVNSSIEVVKQLNEEAARLRAGAEAGPSEKVHSRKAIGTIELESVSFSYRPDEPVLKAVDLTIPKNEFLAIIGPSGAGKSTLMQLLLRLREPVSGEMSVDGEPSELIDPRSWRSRVAYVPQESKLQTGSVRDAIRFLRPAISDERLQRAAEQAHILEEIEAWPDGWDTEVGQLGEQLSGGQRQRVALARALAGDPDVLLLDEPTSSVDPLSERLIAESLGELHGRVTIVVIAHSAGTVDRADRTVVVDQGRLTEERLPREEIPAGYLE